MGQPAESPVTAAQSKISLRAWLGGYNLLKIEVIEESRRYKAFVEIPMYIISGWVLVAGTKSTQRQV